VPALRAGFGGRGGEKRHQVQNIHNQSAAADLFGDEGPLGVVVPRRQECRRYGGTTRAELDGERGFVGWGISGLGVAVPHRQSAGATEGRNIHNHEWLCHHGVGHPNSHNPSTAADLFGDGGLVGVAVQRRQECRRYGGSKHFTPTNGCATYGTTGRLMKLG
jgi:hypothetical protein